MYIEPLVSWPFLAFVELSESFEVQGQMIENENFEALHQVSTIWEGFEEVMYNLPWVFFLLQQSPTLSLPILKRLKWKKQTQNHSTSWIWATGRFFITIDLGKLIQDIWTSSIICTYSNSYQSMLEMHDVAQGKEVMEETSSTAKIFQK